MIGQVVLFSCLSPLTKQGSYSQRRLLKNRSRLSPGRDQQSEVLWLKGLLHLANNLVMSEQPDQTHPGVPLAFQEALNSSHRDLERNACIDSPPASGGHTCAFLGNRKIHHLSERKRRARDLHGWLRLSRSFYKRPIGKIEVSQTCFIFADASSTKPSTKKLPTAPMLFYLVRRATGRGL